MRSRQKITKGTLQTLHDYGMLSNVSPKFAFPEMKYFVSKFKFGCNKIIKAMFH